LVDLLGTAATCVGSLKLQRYTVIGVWICDDSTVRVRG
jgi:hypothetical protein